MVNSGRRQGVPRDGSQTCHGVDSASSGRCLVPEGRTIPEVFLAQVRRQPGQVLLTDQTSGALSYRQILARVLALESELACRPGTYVGIMLPASVAAAVTYLAALFAGKVPVMLNWTVGTRHLAQALDLLGVDTVLTSRGVWERVMQQSVGWEALQPRRVFLEELAARIPVRRKLAAWWCACVRGGRGLPERAIQDPAVVLFTSGSETLPKAVPLTHANLLANLRDMLAALTLRPDDRLLGMLPPFHSFGLTCTVLLALCGGVPVVFHPNPTEGTTLARLVERHRLTVLLGTPAFLGGIVRAARGRELASVRLVISGAEKCPPQLHACLAQHWPQAVLLEGYGITECSPVIAVNDERVPRPGTIGRVLRSFRYVVLDDDRGTRAAPGTPGVLLVQGPSVFGGYLHYTGPSPFVSFEGLSWYWTGDVVREDADGVLTFVGRRKRFVKLGGEMISLPAIEEVLRQHYGQPTDEGPVLAVEAAGMEPNAELTLVTVLDVERDEVNRCIRAAGLSPLHHIRRVVKVPAIPTLGTGKTDYRALKGMLGGEC